MSTIIAYAVAVLLNLGVVTANDVNHTTDNLRVTVRDGKTVVLDPISGTEVIVY